MKEDVHDAHAGRSGHPQHVNVIICINVIIICICTIIISMIIICICICVIIICTISMVNGYQLHYQPGRASAGWAE